MERNWVYKSDVKSWQQHRHRQSLKWSADSHWNTRTGTLLQYQCTFYIQFHLISFPFNSKEKIKYDFKIVVLIIELPIMLLTKWQTHRKLLSDLETESSLLLSFGDRRQLKKVTTYNQLDASKWLSGPPHWSTKVQQYVNENEYYHFITCK